MFFKSGKTTASEDGIASAEWLSWNLWSVQHLWAHCPSWFGSRFIPIFQKRGCKKV